MSETDRERDTQIDNLRPQDAEVPTGPHHEIPEFVGEPPMTIPGAPALLNGVIEEIRAERRAMTKLVERIEKAAETFTGALNRLLDHDARIVVLEEQVAAHERRIADLRGLPPGETKRQ